MGTILVIVIASLTILLVVVGIQVILMISDARKSLKKLNAILEDSVWGGGLLRPEKLSGVLEFFGRNKNMKKHGDGDLRDVSTPERGEGD